MFTDADLSTPIDQFEKLYAAYLKGNDIVIGSRNLLESVVTIKQNIYRRFYGKVFNFYLWGDSELFIRELLGKKGYKDIEWIKPIGDTLPFV